MLGPCIILDHTYLTRSVYSNLSQVVNSIRRILLLPRKSAPDSTSQLGWVTCRTHLSFSSNITIEALGLSQASIDGKLLGLLGTYHQYVQYLLTGPIHQFLTDTGAGYNLGCADLPYHTPRPFQPMKLHFPFKGPVRSHVNHPTIFQLNQEGINKP
jgi:hypothetical protein